MDGHNPDTMRTFYFKVIKTLSDTTTKVIYEFTYVVSNRAFSLKYKSVGGKDYGKIVAVPSTRTR